MRDSILFSLWLAIGCSAVAQDVGSKGVAAVSFLRKLIERDGLSSFGVVECRQGRLPALIGQRGAVMCLDGTGTYVIGRGSTRRDGLFEAIEFCDYVHGWLLLRELARKAERTESRVLPASPFAGHSTSVLLWLVSKRWPDARVSRLAASLTSADEDMHLDQLADRYLMCGIADASRTGKELIALHREWLTVFAGSACESQVRQRTSLLETSDCMLNFSVNSPEDVVRAVAVAGGPLVLFERVAPWSWLEVMPVDVDWLRYLQGLLRCRQSDRLSRAVTMNEMTGVLSGVTVGELSRQCLRDMLGIDDGTTDLESVIAPIHQEWDLCKSLKTRALDSGEAGQRAWWALVVMFPAEAEEVLRMADRWPVSEVEVRLKMFAKLYPRCMDESMGRMMLRLADRGEVKNRCALYARMEKDDIADVALEDSARLAATHDDMLLKIWDAGRNPARRKMLVTEIEQSQSAGRTALLGMIWAAGECRACGKMRDVCARALNWTEVLKRVCAKHAEEHLGARDVDLICRCFGIEVACKLLLALPW